MQLNAVMIGVLLLSLVIRIPNLSAQQSCSDTLAAYNVSLDKKDIQWLLDNPTYCSQLCSELRTDTSDIMVVSAQVLIKLESNNLMNLSSDQIESNEELLKSIIHGAFNEHNLADQTALPAAEWYQIFATQMKE